MTATIPYRVGDWLPSDQAHFDAWLSNCIAQADAELRPFHPVIQNFQDFIEGNPDVFMLFSQMFTEVRHERSPTGEPQLKDYKQMLRVLNRIMTQPPEFNETGLVGFPINAILDWSMGTVAGFSAFLRQDVNAQLKIVLDQWARFLGSRDSVSTLTDKPDGWLSKAAFRAMAPAGTADPRQYFIDTFTCDPAAPNFGYTCWDDFFTREFRDGARPVAGPGDDSIIANACESAPYNHKTNVAREAEFWIKGQPYSLTHMLAGDPDTDRFVGGTVYQAFLSAKSYHRWHSPVSGRIVKAYNVPGTYYSESWLNRTDPAGPNESQGYITSVAARALIFIEADNPAIGLMCFAAVGMAEVSTCQITVYEGQHVQKGEQLGTFHFGGSTHCLIFRPETKLQFDFHGQKPNLNATNILINAKIASVTC